VRLFLNAPRELAEAPIKGYYRYVVSPRAVRDTDVGATFARLPEEALLTLHLHTPHAWLTEVRARAVWSVVCAR
jgi:hypothetical protein